MFSVTDFDIFELFQLLLLPLFSVNDISDVTTFFHFFVTYHFQLFVRKDNTVCNKLDEIFIITII